MASSNHPESHATPPFSQPSDSKPSSTATTTARDYYNSSSADTFYHTIWGGQDIHIGIYTNPTDTIPAASQRTVERMATIASSRTPLTTSTRILDLGAGYGGAARWLAKQYGCHVTCLNLSEVQNARNREKTREEGLEALIEVVDGSFEALPFADESFELIWSQDSFLHSSNRSAVVAEISRVLDADPARLIPIQKRLSIDSGLATRQFYQSTFSAQGFQTSSFEDCTEHLVTHYSKVLAALREAAAAKDVEISDDFVKNAETGLEHWIKGGQEGQLEWGIFTSLSDPRSHT
ncbi:hypothetical protein G7Y79_00049g085120 [Physcia stellaris]|nr:hypothetical protein G7Y79_00049g085120 [Physcia stellaris]